MVRQWQLWPLVLRAAGQKADFALAKHGSSYIAQMVGSSASAPNAASLLSELRCRGLIINISKLHSTCLPVLILV